ncbi:MAG: hypothetical protein WAW06_05905 [bacterium]
MTDKSKAMFAALAVLLIGVAIGALVVGPTIARHHFKRVERMHGPESFVSHMEARINPQPGQAEAVRAILTKYGERLEAVRSTQRTEAEAMFDSLDAELAPILTDDQRERLDRRRHQGPPPDAPR